MNMDNNYMNMDNNYINSINEQKYREALEQTKKLFCQILFDNIKEFIEEFVNDNPMPLPNGFNVDNAMHVKTILDHYRIYATYQYNDNRRLTMYVIPNLGYCTAANVDMRIYIERNADNAYECYINAFTDNLYHPILKNMITKFINN